MIPATLLAFIINEATDGDLERILEAVKSRRHTLRDLRAVAVQKDATVTLDGLSPKALNGLTGTVETIHGNRADVRLDEKSTRELAWSRTKFAGAAQSAETYLLHGVPLGCCVAA